MDTNLFEHHAAGRSPITAGLLAFSGLFTIFGAVHGAPAVWCAFPGSMALLCGWQLAAKPKSVVRLTNTRLFLALGRWRTDIALADISRLIVTERTRRTPSIRIIVRAGRNIRAPGLDFGASWRLLRALRALGVEVDRC